MKGERVAVFLDLIEIGIGGMERRKERKDESEDKQGERYQVPAKAEKRAEQGKRPRPSSRS